MDLFDLFTDREYVNMEIETENGMSAAFRGLVTSQTDPDLTGQIPWPGCRLLLSWISKHLDAFNGKKVVEVGAGTGAVSFFISKYCDSASVVITDGIDIVVDLMNEGYKMNPHKSPVIVRRLMWGHDEANALLNEIGESDIVIGSEIAYNENCVYNLCETAAILLKPGGHFIVGHIDRYAVVTRAFYAAAEKYGFTINRKYNWDECQTERYELITGYVIDFVLSK